jgi:hypothetical protein
MEPEALYKKVCDSLDEYEDKLPNHPETAKIRKQKVDMEIRFPRLKEKP